MKRLFYAAGLFTLVAATYAHGETPVAQANIPFNFQMGSSIMPAGNYVVSESGSIITVRAVTGKPAAMLLTFPASRAAASPNPSLEFNRYGNDYFLAKVWDGSSQNGRGLSKSKREQELRRHVSFGQTSGALAIQTIVHVDLRP